MAQFIKINTGESSPEGDLWLNVGNIALIFMHKNLPAIRLMNDIILVAYHETLEGLLEKCQGKQESYTEVPDAFKDAFDDGDATPV